MSEVLRPDLAIIARHVARGARVLDIGCGDGQLMAALRDEAGVDARGLEIDPANVASAVARGLAVVQGDADVDLVGYPDKGFDYAILSQTLQTARAPTRCSTICCGSASAPSSPSPILRIGGCGCRCCGADACR
ncbi:hypothetical protein GCM10020258_16590 [Sphingomonas yabuuchiae]